MLKKACSRPRACCSKINDFPAQFLLTKHSTYQVAKGAIVSGVGSRLLS